MRVTVDAIAAIHGEGLDTEVTLCTGHLSVDVSVHELPQFLSLEAQKMTSRVCINGSRLSGQPDRICLISVDRQR